MDAGLVDSARRNVMRIALHVLHAPLLNWTATDMGQGLSG
jgi:hypothetical protein